MEKDRWFGMNLSRLAGRVVISFPDVTEHRKPTAQKTEAASAGQRCVETKSVEPTRGAPKVLAQPEETDIEAISEELVAFMFISRGDQRQVGLAVTAGIGR